ncbi:Aspartokinase 1, chloroplastic [Zea mays]|uniref:aspartate kinase n=2 Tax=PACMAD clade TaxID=147370 RepID=A0A317Y8X6_MAIZE|nr:Aspartokinase 1, chloroplastic [Zea mays]
MAAALRFPGVARESLSLDAPVAASKLGRERRPAPASANPGPQCWRRRRGLAVRCQTGSTAPPVLRTEEAPAAAAGARNAQAGFTVVMKFGGSSLASAERMREVAGLILSFPDETPVVVLSAMGKTTNNLLLAGEKAVSCGAPKASEIPELAVIKDLHLRTVDELGLDRSIVSVHHCVLSLRLILLLALVYLPIKVPFRSTTQTVPLPMFIATGLLDELEQLLKGVAMMKELTLRTRDYLVSFGECMSTRIFAAYLNKLGKKARQYDAFDIGFITTDDFTNADILEATYPAVAKRLHEDWMDDPAIPIVTGFLGKVWKDVDGVLTCDPNIYANAIPVPYLTFDEAAELAYFGAQVLHPQSMRPARDGDIPVRVKNSYNRHAPGTVITKSRDMSKSILTSIVLKSNVTMLDIVSTRMLGQYGFLAKVFSIFEDLGISVDCVATSEVSISLTLDPSKLWSRELIQQVSI